jgi:hypothetical protein
MPEIELPKPDELEELKAKSFTRRVALTTAFYAVALAIASLGGNNAMKHMLLSQQQASDQWAFYQARVIREHQYHIERLRLEADLVERGPTLKREARQKFEELLAQLANEEQRYNTAKKETFHEATALERDRDLHRTKDPYFDYAEVLLQIAVVMASIAILATSRPLYIFSLCIAVLGAFLTVNGFMLLVKIPFIHGGH